MQGNEVSATSFLPKDATGCCTEKTIKYSSFINCSCKKSLEFASLHVRKKITDTAVTRAGLDGRQELLQTRMDLILEFHIPEILLIRKLLAPGVDSLLRKKILRGKRRHPESTGHFNPISSSCLFHRFWGERLTRRDGEHLLVGSEPAHTSQQNALTFAIHSENHIQEPVT